MTREQLIEELLSKFRTVFQSMRSGAKFPLENYDLGGAEISLLMRLDGKETGVSVKDLAAQMSITSGAITQVVDKLIEKKLVDRIEDPNDRRSILLMPSQHARELHNKLKAQFAERFNIVFSSLSNEDLQVFISLLSKVKIDQPSSEEQKDA